MIYAIGDIHGHLDKLENAHALIAEDRASCGNTSAPVIHIGDLCDRGSETKGVIDFLLKGLEAGHNWIVLRGNHDLMFLNFLNGGDGSDPHLRRGYTWFHDNLGGKLTLASYGARKSLMESAKSYHARARELISEAHRDFLAGCPLFYCAEGMIFVHAGIRPGIPLDEQTEEDLLWIRDDFLWRLEDHEALIVHGHTPVDEPTHYGNRVNIDTNAGWGGDLIPVVFDEGACFALTQKGRKALSVPGD